MEACCATATPKPKSLYKEKLKKWAKVHEGSLPNGFRYAIIHNATPPNRMDAHLQVHTGSIDEEEHEQGIAHFVEHAVFLGKCILRQSPLISAIQGLRNIQMPSKCATSLLRGGCPSEVRI